MNKTEALKKLWQLLTDLSMKKQESKLSSNQIEELVNALIDAYPSEADLEMMVRIKLNEKLAAVAAGSNLRDHCDQTRATTGGCE